jgi:response regulator RpfG family c-di-GMP phosphodiesterase
MLTALVVSRSAAARNSLTTGLRQVGIRLVTLDDPAEASALTDRPDVVVMDLEGEDEEALALLRRASELDPPVPTVLVIPPSSARLAVAGFHAGASRCLVKPLQAEDLSRAVREAVGSPADRVRQGGDRWLWKALQDARDDLARERGRLVHRSVAAFEALAAALEAKDEYMAGHSVRVAHVAGTIAEEMGCGEDEVETVRLAGQLHDIGMIGVPSRILAHRGPLSAEDARRVREHVPLASQILAPFESLHDVRLFIEGHHERMDGTGYPAGLRAASITRGARILAVAEIFDAVTSPRPHRDAFSTVEGLSLLGRMAGTAIDSAVYEALRTIVFDQKLLTFLVDRPGHTVEDPAGLMELRRGRTPGTPAPTRDEDPPAEEGT